MDRDDSLNASRPAWGEFASQDSGNWCTFTPNNEPWAAAAPGRDASRLAWGESAPLAPPGRPNHRISAANRPLAEDGERVVDNVIGHQDSGPVDFLKLVGLWAAVNRWNEAGEAFRAEGHTSMATAKYLGGGNSFSASLVGVENRTQQELHLRSPFVVYKKLRGLSDNLDVIERGKLLRAVLLEVHALTHPPLRTHDNIARLLQLVWEPDPDLPDHAWPVLVLEYAENGALADFQLDYPRLPFSMKKKLCWDVGCGLSALHSAGIVHGDLKSENVLICDTNDGSKVVAKLADFGYSVMGLEPSDTMALPAVSLPWNAPESHDQLPRDLLRFTDVYSYGLLVWKVTLNGANPFKHIETLASLDKAEFDRQVWILKMEDRVLPLASSTLREPFCNTQESYLITDLLSCTLRLDALKRDLNRSLELLREPSWPECRSIEQLVPYAYHNVEISVLADAVAPICLQLSVVRELEKLSTNHGASGQLARLNLFKLYIERLEWPGAKRRAAMWYLKAIDGDPTCGVARYASGVFELLQRPVPPGLDPTSILESFARRGCYHSLMELRRRQPSSFPALRQEYRRHGGLLRREEKHEVSDMLHFNDFEGYFSFLLAEEGNRGSKLGEMLVSKNDDVLLHSAARYGCTKAINHLLSIGVDINITNCDGETALFQACRAGSLEVVELLLDKGANPVIAATNGETLLHWVFAFDDGDIERATYLLLTNGGEACLYATVTPGHSSAVEYLSLYGTPLHYAILARNETAARSLLSAGSDLFFGYDRERVGSTATFTPFRLAVRELLPGIIKIVIGSPTYGPRLRSYLASRSDSILHFVVESSSKAIRRVALGAKYVSVLIETIDLLRTIEGKERPLKFGMSLLHACIVHGLPVEAIEHLLETSCREDLELVSSVHGHTPLQVAMHLDRKETFLLLLKYGADTQRRLQFPANVSYLQFCAHLGPRAVFYAKNLVACGPLSPKVDDWESFLNSTRDPESLNQFDPPLFALVMGNFELATFFTRVTGSKHLVSPSKDIFGLLFRMFPRLPVSRLQHLLNPPKGLESSPLTGYSNLQRNCFHSIVSHYCRGGPELRRNFRYLLEQSNQQGQQRLLNQPDALGMPPLVPAIAFGRLDFVREMLAAGADPNVGDVPTLNWAYLFLARLQKAPSQVFVVNGGLPLSPSEARRLQDDFKSVIWLLKAHGGQEVRSSNGMIQFPHSQYASKCLNSYMNTAKDDYQIGRGYGKKLLEQQGTRESLRQMWKLASNTIPTEKTILGPMYMLKKSVQSSHTRYQKDLEMRNRFSTADDEVSRPSEASTFGTQLRGITGTDKEVSLAGFARWYFSSPTTEIEEVKPEPPPLPQLQSQLQGAQQQPAQYSPVSVQPGRATDPYPTSTPPPAHRFAPGITAPLYPAPQPPPPRHPIPNQHSALIQHPSPHSQTYPLPQQLPRAQTPEFHIYVLSQQLSPILFSPASNLGEIHARIQQCLDAHFGQAGPGALSQTAGSDPGAPLGSLSVLELENGLNRLLQRRLEVTVTKRADVLKAILCYPNEKASGIPEQVKAFLNEGWMGWRELEEKEAEILMHCFEHGLNLQP